MDFISLTLSTLYIIVIFTIVSIVFRYYIIRQKLKNVPQIEENRFIGSTMELINKSDYGKKLYK